MDESESFLTGPSPTEKTETNFHKSWDEPPVRKPHKKPMEQKNKIKNVILKL